VERPGRCVYALGPGSLESEYVMYSYSHPIEIPGRLPDGGGADMTVIHIRRPWRLKEGSSWTALLDLLSSPNQANSGTLVLQDHSMYVGRKIATSPGVEAPAPVTTIQFRNIRMRRLSRQHSGFYQ